MVTNKKWVFFGGVTVGVLIMIILGVTFIMGGLAAYLLLEKPLLFNGQAVKKINARKGWQSTGLWVKQGEKIDITVIEGEWTHWKGTQPYNSGFGGGYICAEAMKAKDCVEPLPEFSAGGLIGKVGRQVFSVGGGTTMVSDDSGILLLRINDGDVGLYDNDGILKAEIQIER